MFYLLYVFADKNISFLSNWPYFTHFGSPIITFAACEILKVCHLMLFEFANYIYNNWEYLNCRLIAIS